MKRLFTLVFLLSSISMFATSGQYSTLWSSVSATHVPTKGTLRLQAHNYLVYHMDTKALFDQMKHISDNPQEAMTIELPSADGSFRDYKVWSNPIMEKGLADNFSNIKTYVGYAVGNQTITTSISFTEYGFDAMVFDGENTFLIDPYSNVNDDYYTVHFKRDEYRLPNQGMVCQFSHLQENSPISESAMLVHPNRKTLEDTFPLAERTQNGRQLRTYRLALSADHFYCQAATANPAPTMAQCLSKMTTTMNRVNGVYMRDFTAKMVMVANDTVIIWPKATGNTSGNDPYTAAIDGNSNQCLTTNQTQCDTKIGNANYDYGHVFTTGGGGLSLQGVICVTSAKAQTVTGSSSPTGDGFDIDYVAHEMGHAFGGSHTFNDGTQGSCGGGNRVSTAAYEPASGTTIMAYAGICGDDIQQHSDDYFHAKSLIENITYTTTASGNNCPAKTNTGLGYHTLATYTATYSVPDSTPFELIAPQIVDSSADTANRYCWEEWDLGSAFVFSSGVPNGTQGPTFRSYPPSLSRTRVFPKINYVLTGAIAGNGDKLPVAARTLKFKLTSRSFLNGMGTVLVPDDILTLNVQATPKFKVLTPVSGANWTGGTTQTVTWNVANTSAAPINATNVNIFISLDGGNTWPYQISTPSTNFINSGTATFTVPNPAATTTAARVKVKGANNVFFNVNGANFTITKNTSLPVTPTGVETPVVALTSMNVTVFPVPVTETLHIATDVNNTMNVTIINAIGQSVWTGTMNSKTEVPVSSWAKGISYVQVVDNATGERIVKTVVVE